MAKHFLDIPGSGPLWHKLRRGTLEKLDAMDEYTDGFKNLVSKMVERDHNQRPSASEILKILFSLEEANKRKR